MNVLQASLLELKLFSPAWVRKSAVEVLILMHFSFQSKYANPFVPSVPFLQGFLIFSVGSE